MSQYAPIIAVLWLAVPLIVWTDAQRREKQYFTQPWSLPGWAWGLVVYLLGLFGLAAYALACAGQARNSNDFRARAVEALEEANRRSAEKTWDKDYWDNYKLQ